jgi:hypothetical protein
VKHVPYLLVPASWVLVTLTAHFFSQSSGGPAPIVFISVSLLFMCAALYLMGRGVLKHQDRLIVAGLLILIPELLCGFSLTQEIAEIGSVPVPLTFVVVDAKTGSSIPNAIVKVYYGIDPAHHQELAVGESAGQTNGAGGVTLNPRMTFTSSWRRFHRTSWIRFWDKVFEITAEGYQPVAARLDDYAGQGIRMHEPPPGPLIVRMQPRALNVK